MSKFHEFPKWKYHQDKPAVVVPHAEAEEALGEGWVNTPADLHVKEVEHIDIAEEPAIEEEIQKSRRGRKPKVEAE